MKIELYTDDLTDDLFELLLEADPDMGAIRRYLVASTILVALEEGVVVGIAVLAYLSNRFELKNIAVRQCHQGQGIAKRLIAAIKSQAKGLGGKKIYVGTGNSSLSQLALYQKCGFRMDYIEKNYFFAYPEEIYENGMRCLDRVVLCAEL